MPRVLTRGCKCSQLCILHGVCMHSLGNKRSTASPCGLFPKPPVEEHSTAWARHSHLTDTVLQNNLPGIMKLRRYMVLEADLPMYHCIYGKHMSGITGFGKAACNGQAFSVLHWAAVFKAFSFCHGPYGRIASSRAGVRTQILRCV